MPANPFALFICTYRDVHHDWLNFPQFEKLLNHKFEHARLNEARDIYILASFTGYGHKELYTFRPEHWYTDEYGRQWLSKDRQKNHNPEAVPLLPICIKILNRYKNHPKCVRKHKLFPVPTVQEYNRCLKECARILGIRINLRSHKARFFFANEVTYNQGVQSKTIGKLIGDKSDKALSAYLDPGIIAMEDAMDRVEEKLFNEDGR